MTVKLMTFYAIILTLSHIYNSVYDKFVISGISTCLVCSDSDWNYNHSQCNSFWIDNNENKQFSTKLSASVSSEITFTLIIK